MVEDVVRTLGYLCLGTRLKRVADRLQSQTQEILDALPVKVPAGQQPLLAALDRLGPLSIGELAEAIGVSQPGITRSVAQLTAAGLVGPAAPGPDQRRRVVDLTPGGRALVERAKREVWPLVDRAVADLCAGLDGPLLGQLLALEDGLAAETLDRRRRKSEGGRP